MALVIIVEMKSECALDSAELNTNKLILKNFKNFNELKFNCSKPFNISILEIRPDNKLLINNSINFTGLSISALETYFSITLVNINGFDLEANPFTGIKLLNYYLENIFWFISSSNFEFYLQNKPINEFCDENLFKKL